jgi:hypothetical protein
MHGWALAGRFHEDVARIKARHNGKPQKTRGKKRQNLPGQKQENRGTLAISC